MFGAPVSFTIDRGHKSVKTQQGACISLFLGFFLFAFALYKTEIMLNNKSVNVVSSVKDNFIKTDQRFGSTDGFAIAVGWTDYNLETMTLDPSLAEIKAIVNEWGFDDQDAFYDISKELPTHECTKEELALVN